MKKIVRIIVALFTAQTVLTACNLPVGPTAVAPSQNELATQAAIDQAIAQTAEAQSVSVQQTLQAQNSASDLIITDMQVSAKEFYYGGTGCGPTEVTISMTANSSASVNHAGVQRLYFSSKQGSLGGTADEMSAIGNNRYSFTIQGDDLSDPQNDWFFLELVLYASDTAGNEIATGEWGDGVGDGHIWPLNPINLFVPTLQLLPCHAQLTLTQQPQVSGALTFTPTPYLQQPTKTPQPPAAPSVQTRSNYVELGNWYTTEETADMDFSGANELAYMAATSDYPDHSLGQNVSQGEGIMMARVSSPSYDTCRAIPAWNTGIIVHADETYCYLTAGGTYGYFHIDKIENRGSEIANWVIGLSYTIWVP